MFVSNTHSSKKKVMLFHPAVSTPTILKATAAAAAAAGAIFEVRRRAVPPPRTITDRAWAIKADVESWAKPRQAAPDAPVIVNPFRKGVGGG